MFLKKFWTTILKSVRKHNRSWCEQTTFRVKKNSLDIDWNFIKSLEGFETKGYVPREERGSRNKVKSGVTIASGFDLGHHDIYYLRKIKMPLYLIKLLAPYLELQGEVARSILKKHPLTLSEEDANIVNKLVKADKAKEIAELYNKDSKVKFYSLDRVPQTVIMSVAFQYGNLKKRTPNFWKQVTSQDWLMAEKNLKNFGDAYTTRRKKEAKLLRSYLKEKGILYV